MPQQSDRPLTVLPAEEPPPAAATAALATLQTALAHPTPGAFMLANMPQEEFDQHLQMLKIARARVQEIQLAIMVQGVHYGKVPGIEKPFLHQPGAEVLAQPLHLVPQYIGSVEWGDGDNRPVITAVSECRLHYGTLDGPVVGTGRGACTSWEKKYRYRQTDRSCPECSRVGSVRRGKEEWGGGWYCSARHGGCAAKFKKEDPRITNQELGVVENPDQADLFQTILSMADKRAYVKSVRTTTATSDLFTQDDDLVQGEQETAAGVGKNADPPRGDPPKKPAADPPQQKSPPKKRVYTYDEAWTMTADAFRNLQADVNHPRLTAPQIDQIGERALQQGWETAMVTVTLQQRLGLPKLQDVPAGPENILFRRLLYIFSNYPAAEHFTPPREEDPFGNTAPAPEPAAAQADPPWGSDPAAPLSRGVPPLDATTAEEAMAQIKRLLPSRKGKPLTASALRELRDLAAEGGWYTPGPPPNYPELEELLARHLSLRLDEMPWSLEREMRWFLCTFQGPNAPEVDAAAEEQDIPA